MDRPPLVTLLTDSKAGKDDILLPRAYDPPGILQVTEHTLTVDKSVIPNSISIYRDTIVTMLISHPHSSKVPKTFPEDETILLKVDSCTETGIHSPLLKDSYTEPEITSPWSKTSIQRWKLLPKCSETPVREENYFPTA